jgi:hypothetical protein
LVFSTRSLLHLSGNISSVAMEALLSRRRFKYKLRHWPPGTDNLPFVPPFFCSPATLTPLPFP